MDRRKHVSQAVNSAQLGLGTGVWRKVPAGGGTPRAHRCSGEDIEIADSTTAAAYHRTAKEEST